MPGNVNCHRHRNSFFKTLDIKCVRHRFPQCVQSRLINRWSARSVSPQGQSFDFRSLNGAAEAAYHSDLQRDLVYKQAAIRASV